jgi:hypothetical protein
MEEHARRAEAPRRLARRGNGNSGDRVKLAKAPLPVPAVSTIVALTAGGVNPKIWLREARFETLGIKKARFQALQQELIKFSENAPF